MHFIFLPGVTEMSPLQNPHVFHADLDGADFTPLQCQIHSIKI